ncbi:MAG: hypothetical protein LBP53_01990 [Candidatus Peribacteria bacterium]|jgi:hypothetical protein|nr:hypothetical protein [Candidatus Peribacteria bacterium]
MTYPEFQPARNLFWKQRKIPFFALFFLFFLGTMLIISIFSPSQANAPLPSSISSGTLSELDVQPSSGFIAPKI